MRILVWPVHAGWLTAFVQGGHEYVLPVLPNRSADGPGSSGLQDLPESVTEVPVAGLTGEFDAVVLQRPHEVGLATEWLGRTPGVEVPAIYLEHQLPAGVGVDRHPMADRPTISVVHVSAFSRLVWDCGTTATQVVEYGILDPGPRYSGEVASAATVVPGNPTSPDRSAGTDLVPVFSAVGPVDYFGASRPDAKALSRDDQLWEIARRRVFLQLGRWSAPGIALIEAMQIGMPVLAVAAAGAGEGIPADGGVVSSDVDRLCREYRMLLNEPEIARFMGRQARRAALARYGLVRFLDDWDRVLAETVSG